jgi:hypothetical protein
MNTIYVLECYALNFITTISSRISKIQEACAVTAVANCCQYLRIDTNHDIMIDNCRPVVNRMKKLFISLLIYKYCYT